MSWGLEFLWHSGLWSSSGYQLKLEAEVLTADIASGIVSKGSWDILEIEINLGCMRTASKVKYNNKGREAFDL